MFQLETSHITREKITDYHGFSNNKLLPKNQVIDINSWPEGLTYGRLVPMIVAANNPKELEILSTNANLLPLKSCTRSYGESCISNVGSVLNLLKRETLKRGQITVYTAPVYRDLTNRTIPTHVYTVLYDQELTAINSFIMPNEGYTPKKPTTFPNSLGCVERFSGHTFLDNLEKDKKKDIYADTSMKIITSWVIPDGHTDSILCHFDV